MPRGIHLGRVMAESFSFQDNGSRNIKEDRPKVLTEPALSIKMTRTGITKQDRKFETISTFLQPTPQENAVAPSQPLSAKAESPPLWGQAGAR